MGTGDSRKENGARVSILMFCTWAGSMVGLVWRLCMASEGPRRQSFYPQFLVTIRDGAGEWHGEAGQNEGDRSQVQEWVCPGLVDNKITVRGVRRETHRCSLRCLCGHQCQGQTTVKDSMCKREGRERIGPWSGAGPLGPCVVLHLLPPRELMLWVPLWNPGLPSL